MMKTPATQLRRIVNVSTIPDGVYDGVWGGYCVNFSVDGVEYEAQTLEGIRTPRAECKVTVDDGTISVGLCSKAVRAARV